MRIHHVALRTPDVARLERFYVDVLGLDVVRRDPGRSVWLDASGAVIMLEHREPGEPDVPRGAMDLVAFAIAPHARVQVEERLARAGVAIEARTAFTLYFRDPDGRRVGLSAFPEPLD